MSKSVTELLGSSFLYGANAPYIEALYDDYLQDRQRVPLRWQRYFDDPHASAPPQVAIEQSRQLNAPPPVATLVAETTAPRPTAAKQGAVLRLIDAYRVRGHQCADLDPLKHYPASGIEELNPAYHQLTEEDMSLFFDTGSLVAPQELMLKDILAQLRQSYCGTIGYDYMHLSDTAEKRWLQQRIERPRPPLDSLTRQRLLQRIVAAEGLERYLHSRYVGQKRFSLEGGEALIPLLDDLIQRSGEQKIAEIVLGMAHRGRLNVLINILGKAPQRLFNEFEGELEQPGAGDVKYHKGYSTNINTAGVPLHLVLAFNPSHLEIVAPVVQGSVRARQQRYGDHRRERVVPVVVHGDSAFAAQGVVMETLQMSQARGYTTGGTLHIVINNQIGFTTSHRRDTRSTLYATDVAKMVEAPILHVNGDDPDAVVWVGRLALAYRQHFHKDVVIDLVCYRRHGHNEADEPAITQPMMYQKIATHPTLVRRYSERLIAEQLLTEEGVKRLQHDYRQRLVAGEVVALDIGPSRIESEFRVNWRPYLEQSWELPCQSAVSLARLRLVSERLQQLPEGFKLHPRVARVLEDRRKMAAGALAINWGAAETLAYATLIMEGFDIRLSGQDSGRGTFSHRHAVLHNQHQAEAYIPLQHLAPEQPECSVIDSLLSEEAALAYEYGYATAEPKTLVVWEAQFGDFANGAQVVIDQFISSGEAKWGRLCGLTMFLPHGYEGQGAEHSSARLERYLQLCAEQNIQVCLPSTPAQLFHLLRRQMVRPYRKPLIVMMPKSLLRHKESISSLEQLYQGEFFTVMDDSDAPKPREVTRLLLCSGKLYYELLQKRRELGCKQVAIIRLEQHYPFPKACLTGVLQRYRYTTQVVWCQEEPKNQGAWYASQHPIRQCLLPQQQLEYVGRSCSAAPAVGSFKLHAVQQRQLLEEAFSQCDDPQ
ncbi:2-oxoglutarate dehydrogenase E1 component [Ectothiorhodospiraceae bacterium BW-2]|nr:2-oxoglutarate dehydrogenase E1 component [Ectothiorhodospiraceae bacterium BW-2]